MAGDRRAKYEQIADDLAACIEAGDYPPGSRLPTEPQLMERYGASSTTVRAAIKSLATSGLVETQHGSGTYVVERTLLRISATHTEDLDRRAGITAQDSWSTDVLEAGHTPSQRFECLMVPANNEDAELLGVAPGDPLVMRRCWRSVDGKPASIEASIFPQWLVQEIPLLASPHDISSGTTLYVSEHGHPMEWHRDILSSRAPTREELTWFGTPPGVSVLVRRRISYESAGGRVLRIMNTIYRSDMHEVVYDVRGRGNKKI